MTMTSSEETQSLVKTISQYASSNDLKKISDVIRTATDISLFTRELEIAVGGLFFWEMRLSVLENHAIDCEGLSPFVEKLKASDQTAKLLQTIFLVDQKYYLYCYRYQNDIFGVFLKQKRDSE